MKISLIFLLFSLSLSQVYSQIKGRVFIESSHWMDGVGKLDIIEFGPENVYRQFHWSPRQPPILTDVGSYQFSNDTIFCQSTSSDRKFERIFSRQNEKTVLLRNEKVYNADGTLSDMRIHGPVLQEFEKELYKLWKKTKGKH